MKGFRLELTSFIGRRDEVAEVVDLLGRFRLVTVTGPGGIGKTRLAAHVAEAVTARFADGVWLAELGGIGDPSLVPEAVAQALGVTVAPGSSVVESLARVLAVRQLLVVLDNCEHVVAAVAELCANVLAVADDVRLLATSREPVRISGEARFRLGPLGLPGAGAAGLSSSEAVALFADRARQADPRFTLDGTSGPVAAKIVAQLDGMPLAIELAAARVESLGLAQLGERLGDRFGVLTGGDRLAPERLQSLWAAVDWSYQLLTGEEQGVFRALSIFPGPFSPEAARQVAGPDAGSAVGRLVDCSLVSPPRAGPDGRDRYAMLETLRAFGASQLERADEAAAAARALAAHALGVARQASAAMLTRAGERAGAAWLDAEEATMSQALSWAQANDPDAALALATALASWWSVRGRNAAGYAVLSAACEHAAPGSDAWCDAQALLGNLATTQQVALGHFTAARDALATKTPSVLLVNAHNGRAAGLAMTGRVTEVAGEAKRGLDLARQLSYPEGQVRALTWLATAALLAADAQESLDWLRQADRIDQAAITARTLLRHLNVLTAALIMAGEFISARQQSERALEVGREAGERSDLGLCLALAAYVACLTGDLAQARAKLLEAIDLGSQTGVGVILTACLDIGGLICADSQRMADALTLWAAFSACPRELGRMDLPGLAQRRREHLQRAEATLGPERTRQARERGTVMSLSAATELALLMIAENGSQAAALADPTGLSARQRELVTLVARGRTDAQIAEQLYISVRTVRSHLDRIRERTGCRRRADLTRLALQNGLI